MIDTVLKLIAFTLLGFCIFFFGVVATKMELSPATALETPASVTQTLFSAYQIEECNNGIRWAHPQGSAPLKTFIRKDAYDTTYTIYTSTHDTTARLIDTHGHVVHSWSFKYHDIFKDTSHIIALGKLNNKYFYLRDFHLFDNGDIILMISAGGVTPWGMGFVKLDKNSNVIWTYTGYVNNDFEIGDDGILYTIEHEVTRQKPAYLENVFLPYLEDNIVMLDSFGQEQDRFSLLDSIAKSPYAALLNGIENDGIGDPTHSNSIEYIQKDNPNVPWIKQGHLIISVRNLSAMVVVNPKTYEVTHAQALPTKWQHDIDLLDNGHLLMFDNRGDITGKRYTRVIEMTSASSETIWTHTQDAQGLELHSAFFGQQQRKKDGSTFITYAEHGQLFTVDQEGDIQWAYNTPLYNIVDGVKKMPVITSAQQYDSDFIQFIDKYCIVP